MKTRQTIAIIGASGCMGAALTRSLARGNYRLLLHEACRERSEALAATVGREQPSADLEASGCPLDACWEADIIILSIPYEAEQEVARAIREVSNQKIVVSLSNRDEKGRGTMTLSAAEELQQALPHARIVKAFSTISASAFDHKGKPGEALLAGNDSEALESVAELVALAGFRPVMAGGLEASRELEKGKPSSC